MVGVGGKIQNRHFSISRERLLRIVAPFVTFRFDFKEFRSISRSVFARISEDYRRTEL